MSDGLIFSCSHWKDDPERALLPFVAAKVAAIAGQTSVVFCTMDAVWLGTKGGLDGIGKEGFPDLAVTFADFVENGGQVWLCQTCAKPRGITEDMLVEGARIVGAAKLIEQAVEGAKVITIA
jgi:uncharacterized protein